MTRGYPLGSCAQSHGPLRGQLYFRRCPAFTHLRKGGMQTFEFCTLRGVLHELLDLRSRCSLVRFIVHFLPRHESREGNTSWSEPKSRFECLFGVFQGAMNQHNL